MPTPQAVPAGAQLTDLPMVKQGRADRLKAAGIDTVEKLWKADLAKLAEHPVFQTDDGFLGQLPLLQGFAEAHAKGKPVVYAADSRIFELKEPIYHVDLEFDGPACEIFLWGILEHKSGRIEQWFDHQRKGQEEMVLRFQKLVKDEDPTIIMWGGHSSDILQIRRACDRYRMPTDWVRKVHWFDLQTDLVFTGNPETQRVYLPVKNFSSDTVAKYFGYEKPRLRVRDGYQALKMYQAYKRHPRPGIKEDLEAYNAEDVKHTRIVLDGVRDLMKGHR
ncbi:MAG TPA: ribonuclease H-like domain-containing protein [Candidatus Thermoplasmatota archaeon]|nr:ribonuclease H-like domain-containing protein [Candidatus Thermoplasmatota archaeon]